MVRNVIESLYKGLCTITGYQKVENPLTKITSLEPHEVATDQKCRVSYQKFPQAEQSESVNALTQVVKLFISPDITIEPGSKITVIQNGITETYKSSGKPAVYENHQEVVLELEGEEA